MPDDLAVDVHLNSRDWIATGKIHREQPRSEWDRRWQDLTVYREIVIAACGIGGGLLAAPFLASPVRLWIGVATLLAAFVLVILSKLRSRKYVAAYVDEDPRVGIPRRFVVCDDGFRVEYASGHGLRNWTEINRIEESGDYLLVFDRTGGFWAIPIRDFADERHRRVFTEAIRDRIRTPT